MENPVFIAKVIQSIARKYGYYSFVVVVYYNDDKGIVPVEVGSLSGELSGAMTKTCKGMVEDAVDNGKSEIIKTVAFNESFDFRACLLKWTWGFIVIAGDFLDPSKVLHESLDCLN